MVCSLYRVPRSQRVYEIVGALFGVQRNVYVMPLPSVPIDQTNDYGDITPR